MKSIRSLVLCSFLVLSAAFAVVVHGSVTVSALDAGGQNVTISPASTEISVEPGGSVTKEFDVFNQGATDFNVTTYAAPYRVEGIAYDPHFTQLPGTTDASKWVHTSQKDSQKLAAHQEAGFSYTVTVPQGTAPGGYYAVIFAETTPTGASNGVVAHNRVGNILYITVQGDVKTGGAVKEKSVPLISTGTTIPLGMLVSNTGGVHFLTDAKVTVKSIFGKEVYHADLQRYVLPQTERDITVNWQNNALIGLYQVERSATVAGSTQTLPSRWVLVVNPWVIACVVALLLIIIGELIFRRKSKRKI